MRVLVIEDSKVDQFLVITFLENFFEGVIVETVSNGLEALKLCNENTYDLKFLDINMPSMNGFEFLDKFCANTCEANIIMLSSSLHEEEKHKALSYGCVGAYIEKPLKKEHLTIIRKLLKVESSV